MSLQKILLSEDYDVLRQNYLTSAMKSDNFKSWFAGSKVIEDDGLPKIVFHYSRNSAKNWNSFKESDGIGFHFGTSKASLERFDNTLSMIEEYTYENIDKLYN